MIRNLLSLLLIITAVHARSADKPLTGNEAFKILREFGKQGSKQNQQKVIAYFTGLKGDQQAQAIKQLIAEYPTFSGRAHRTLDAIFRRFSPAVLPELMLHMDDPTIFALIRTQGVDGLKALLTKLPSAGTQERLDILQLIPKFSDSVFNDARGSNKEFMPVLEGLLADSDPTVTIRTLRVIGLLATRDNTVSSRLKKYLTSNDAQIRRTTLQTLTNMHGGNQELCDALLEIAFDTNASTTIRDLAIKAYISAKLDKQTIKAAKSGDQAATDKILNLTRTLAARLFTKDNPIIAVNLVNQLKGLGVRTVPAFVSMLDSDQESQVRFATFALARLGPENVPDLPERLLELLKHNNPKIRRNAAEAIGILGGPEQVAALLPLLADQEVEVKYATRDALLKLQKENQQVTEAIAKMEQDLETANVSKPDPSPGRDGDPEDYEIGGPLAGLKLPLFPTQHGEPAGYPGSIPSLAEKAIAEHQKKMAEDPKVKPFNALNTPFTPVGQFPELELYPGAAEHWRAYMFKYMPVRSSFDKQSQIKNWTAPDIPGTTKQQISTYAAPLSWVPRWGHQSDTGCKDKPIPVVKLKAGDEPIQLDCGILPKGVYAIRIIAATPSEQIHFFRKNLYIWMRVNDGLDGSVSQYLKRINYTDEFYSVSELFFHAPEKRQYNVEIGLGKDSEVELLIHNITLDDALTGSKRQAIKTAVNMKENKAKVAAVNEKRKNPVTKRIRQYLAEERDIRNRWLWQTFPHPNSQGNRPYRFPKSVTMGVPPEFAGSANRGNWSQLCIARFNKFNQTPVDPSVFLRNSQLGLDYTIDDFSRQRPLPDPYPLKDNGTALTFPDPDYNGGKWIAPIANQVRTYYWQYPTAIDSAVERWVETGNDEYAKDAAIGLARWAYAFPTLYSQSSYLHNNIAAYGQFGRNARFRKRITTSQFYRWYTQYANKELDDYEVLYPYISNNWELSRAVSEFVPWVKTPKDVIKLIDTYLVQCLAKRILRYQWHVGEMKIAKLASILGDNTFTNDWMDFLFSRTFVYPLPLAGLDDLMISGTTREGTEYVASAYYGGGENAIPKAADLISYLEAGGDPKYDLSNSKRYPKPLDCCYWLIDRLVAGLNHIRIGDVCGPDKHYGSLWKGLDEASYWGWRWSQDPRFAFIRVNYFGKRDFTDQQWSEIETAAKSVKRPPWLDNPSRVSPNWAAILEAGRQYDDQRFRSALMVRTGLGWGHHHHDPLDLQIYTHGSMATCDGGQRPSYSKPPDRSTYMHNTVEVADPASGNREWLGYSWTRSLSDNTGTKYVKNQAVPPQSHPSVKQFVRQNALIYLDDGHGSRKLTPKACALNGSLPKDVTLPNSYVFDVFRINGGKQHTYCFHGNLSERVTDNCSTTKPYEQADETTKQYLNKLSEPRQVAETPEHLQVTFKTSPNQTRADLKSNYVPNTSYYTRLHLLGETGTKTMHGSLNCVKWRYKIPMVFIQKRANQQDEEAMQSTFAAIIEPYANTPFISSIQRLKINDNQQDADQAVALQVKTVNGNTDICFADGTPNRLRKFDDLEIAAEFAYLSTDKDGLRQATITDGSLLKAKDLIMKPAKPSYSGRITAVDYLKKSFTIDQVWPELYSQGRGTIIEVGSAGRMTAYNVASVKPGKAATVITVKGGADYYQSCVNAVDSESNTVYCSLTAGTGNEGYMPTPGIDKNWVASNSSLTKFWRADYLAGNRDSGRIAFKLHSPVSSKDFAKGQKFRLWEYGVGDLVTHTTSASLKRTKPNTYLLESDVDLTLGLAATGLEISHDGSNWIPLKTVKNNGLQEAHIRVQQLRAGKLYLKITP